jgi:TPR repeat protein
VKANRGLAKEETKHYYECCGKSICGGCIYSFGESGNIGKCPFCNLRISLTDKEGAEELMKRAEANDPASICLLANDYYRGTGGLQQDHAKAMELYARAAELGWGKAHCRLADNYYEGGDLKKAKFHYEAAAIIGNELARYNLGFMEAESRNMERAVKHWMIAASAGEYHAMYHLLLGVGKGIVSKDAIEITLAAYNNSCAEMRSEARDAYMRRFIDRIG